MTTNEAIPLAVDILIALIGHSPPPPIGETRREWRERLAHEAWEFIEDIRREART